MLAMKLHKFCFDYYLLHGFRESKSLLKVVINLAVLKRPCVVTHRSSHV